MHQSNEEINALLSERIEANDFPSAVYLVAEKGKVVFADALGEAVRVPEKIPATVETIYDLASLTKPLIVGLLSALFLERKLFDLDDSVSQHLPEFERAGKGFLTFRQLLTHTTGFPAWLPFYLLTDDKEKVLETIAAMPPEAEPNERVKYSDLNFIALGVALERMSGLKLDELATREIFKPLNLKKTFFNPPVELNNKIAASEIGNHFEKNACEDLGYDVSKYAWREDVIWGRVHDGNCYFMKGVSGHAGLFSNAEDTLKIALQFLPEHAQLLKPETCSLFRQNMTEGLEEDRSFAWQLASTKNSTASEDLSQDSFGHLGFTGTSLWIDAARDRVFILLTNRTHDHPLPLVLINDTRRKFNSLASNALNKIETSRLILRPVTMDDIEELHAIWTDEGVRKYLWDDEIISRETALLPIKASIETFASHGFGLYAVIHKEDEKMIGFCGFRFLDDTNEIELLYGILPDYWNKGLTTEAVNACLKFGFEEKGLEKIIAITNAPNTASIRVMEKSGMKFLKRDMFQELDSIFYAITREEFESSEG